MGRVEFYIVIFCTQLVSKCACPICTKVFKMECAGSEFIVILVYIVTVVYSCIVVVL